MAPKHICLIADDGTSVGHHLAAALAARRWPVVVLQRPGNKAAMPDICQAIALSSWDETQLQTTLEDVQHQFGPIGFFIHLHPSGTGDLFASADKAIVRHVFLTAKHLKRSLASAAQLPGRAGFVTVTRLDGQLGLGATRTFGAVSGGLFGLTKTLALEWPEIFCRAVDVSPTLATPQAVNALLAELQDPNRLIVETGWNEQGRVTLIAGH